jgi:DNA (cytosine-5)-methyltransferase 1
VRVGGASAVSKKTFTALFAGGGGADLGAIAAGLEPCESVEYDPAIAEVHKANINGKMHVANILDCDPYRFEKPDILHASPVCKQFSTANANKGEAQLDIDCARKVAEFIQVLQPKHFTLENVEAYRKSKSFHLIVEMLHKLGYFCNWQVLNAADFGVPQSRRRLILIAVKDGFIPSLPPKEKHIGWYEAIADCVHDLPDSKLADWQLKALPDEISDHLFFIATI